MISIYYLRTTRYSTLRSDSGKLLVIRDGKHDAIMERIRSGKRTSLREKYFFYDASNTVEQELRKYQYLKDDGAITEEEFVKVSNALLEKN